MITYPIGDPIGSHRVCPNRPRIPHIESCRVSPFSSGSTPFNLTVGASLRPAFPEAECTGYAGGAS
jgi:hypothetical protein